MSITKNHQTNETLFQLAAAAFPNKTVCNITELTEGMFNAAYRVDFTDDTASILKISAANNEGLLSNEINLMQAEVSAMELLKAHGIPYIPCVRFSDFTRTLCSGSYFFMDVVPGRSLNSCQADLSSETIHSVLCAVGRLQRQMECIRNAQFGLVGDTCRFNALYEMVCYLFHHVLGDAKKMQVSFCFSPDELLARLKRDCGFFDEVTQPALVHWDMWEGNIFVHEGRLSGVIDWERAMWGDPLMDDRFRSKSCHPAFLEGYGKIDFTPAEKRRIVWYDVFLYVTMLTECHYRQYEDTEWNAWLTSLLKEAWEKLE